MAFIGTIREEAHTPDGAPAVLAQRLRIDNRRIAEVETLVVRNERAAENLEKLGKPNPVFLKPVPPAERMSREDLIQTANRYFLRDAAERRQGCLSVHRRLQPHREWLPNHNVPTPEGQKRPDPATAANYSAQWSCKDSGLLHFVWRIRDRRFVAIDEKRGLVFSFAFFDHALGKQRTFRTPRGRTVTAGPTQPWTWELGECSRSKTARSVRSRPSWTGRRMA